MVEELLDRKPVPLVETIRVLYHLVPIDTAHFFTTVCHSQRNPANLRTDNFSPTDSLYLPPDRKMFTETLPPPQRSSNDLAAGYLLWLLSHGSDVQTVNPRSAIEEALYLAKKRILERPLSTVPTLTLLKEPLHHRRIISEEIEGECLVDSQHMMKSPHTSILMTPPPRVCSPNLNEVTPSSDTINKDTLPKWFQESKTTVVIGKGHLPRKTPGNLLLRQMVNDRIHDYQETNRRGRAVIVSDLYHQLERLNPDGRCFGNFDHMGQWEEAREHCARDKIAATFRDCLSHLYKSSTQSKVAKRRIRKAENSNVSNEI